MNVERSNCAVLAALAGLLLGASGGPFVPTDGSLTPNEYRAMGVASVDRRWSGADHQAALQVLQSLPREALPRAGSARSAQVFDRLVESLDDWLEFAAVRGRDALSASALYGWSTTDDLFFDRERLELLTANAEYILDQLDRLAQEPAVRSESVETSAQTRELLELQRARRPQLREDLGLLLVVVLAGLVEVGELPASRPETRLVLRDSLVELAPRALRHLPGSHADVLRTSLRTMAATDGNQAIRADIEQLAMTEVPPAD